MTIEQNAVLQESTFGDQPLRSELFSTVEMESHGRYLSFRHGKSGGKQNDRLLARLAENECVLLDSCSIMTGAAKQDRQLAPAAEWLLDNFYLIEEHIYTAKRHFPNNYSKELPCLLSGPSAGYPRVYDIALEAISHGDGRIDAETLRRFVAAYQENVPLKLGELWAVPIMLRLALIENLRRVAVRLSQSHASRNLADFWVDKMVTAAEHDPGNLILTVADMTRSEPVLKPDFVAELARRLSGQGPALALPLTWIGQQLAHIGSSIDHLVREEAQQQAADQVSVSNSIGSLRALGSIDWREFVEIMSSVEAVLRTDPTGDYPAMDFATRDHYRHAIEKIARRSPQSESQVAQHAISLAESAVIEHGVNDRRAHVGYYLVDHGIDDLENKAKMRRAPLESLLHAARNVRLRLYLFAILASSIFVAAGMLWLGALQGIDLVLLGVLALPCLLASSHLGTALVNWLITLLASPRKLPKMDYTHGIPAAFPTMVVIPALLNSVDVIEQLAEALEIRFLANRDPQLFFCLLTDYGDAPTEHVDTDAAFLAVAEERIQRLNAAYGGTADAQTGPFLLLHRPRKWNPHEHVWMGFERKRGKLSDLNCLLRGNLSDAFAVIVGNSLRLRSVKYVITLDTDTQLPRDAARELVGAMAHPLNRPVFDHARQRVTHGYGVLQPRVATSLPTANASFYETLYGGEAGIDPYTRAVSDVYQDVFGEGSFIGKGIYDVDAFDLAFAGRFPENRILSHDLIEGCYARSGLLSDIVVFEKYPSSFESDVSRRHRWIRGDWQLASWILPRVPTPTAENSQGGAINHSFNPLSALSRWKLFDNLRRSIVPATLVLLFLFGWCALPAPTAWTIVLIGLISFTALSASLLDLIRKPQDVNLPQHCRAVLRTTGRHLAHSFMTLTFLPYEAYYSLDAIIRTNWRLLVTRSRLLEWTPSAIASQHGGASLCNAVRDMWISPALTLLVATFLATRPVAFPFSAVPLLLLWFIAPVVAWRVSQPVIETEAEINGVQASFLRRLSRKTWAFFETYVGPENNWLPPDNVQENPVAVVARRTSPTNMGLSLLANLAAADFGYISTGQMLDRTARAFESMNALERYQGHFYNWYDTQYLKPLLPIYISTVDSGNLTAHLLTLRSGLLELVTAPIVNAQLWQGIDDTYQMLIWAARSSAVGAQYEISNDLAEFQRQVSELIAVPPQQLSSVTIALSKLMQLAEKFPRTLLEEPETEVQWWIRALVHQCEEAQTELFALVPWVRSGELLIGLSADLDAIPNLQQLARLNTGELPPECQPLSNYIEEASRQATDRIRQINKFIITAANFAQAEYGFLYEPTTHLLAIGYNLSERRRDLSFYDLLASEARLASFIAIAQGKVPQDNWFALGRQLTIAGGDPILLSWSGSMFEYLMPMLVMPTFPNTLLLQTCKSAVQRQIAYGVQRGVPWGISESGFNTFDSNLNYQYRAFGVPGLGLKRGLGDDLVVAPYASMMALMVTPEAAYENLLRLSREGFEGRYGMYEAIDYTPSRVARGKKFALVQSFMVHHQGMGFLALAYLLLQRPMQRRFEADPLLQSAMLLLHERIPRPTAYHANVSDLADIRSSAASGTMPMRVLHRVDSRTPETQLLSNGRYHVMVSGAGGGYSRCRDLAVSRWREDGTRDNWGAFCYVRDTKSGAFWSTAFQPTLVQPTTYEVIFSEGRAEIRRTDRELDMHTDIVVSPEDDIELRRTRITNRSRVRRTIDLTSYVEVVLAPAAADDAHPAFSNLFVQTELLREHSSILCTRRPRTMNEVMPWMFHMMTLHGANDGTVSFETNRLKFLGRGNTTQSPDAMRCVELSNSDGSVLDPIVAIRRSLSLAPGEYVIVDIVTGVTDTREACMRMVQKFQDLHLADRVFELAWTHAHVVLRQLNATEADAQLYSRLANAVLYSNPSLRADASVLVKNHRGQSGLWSYSISGDLPIVLVQIKDQANIELVRQMVQAHAYWRLKGLAVDLVIWNEDHAGYRQVLHEQIMGLVASGLGAQIIDRPGGIFVRVAEQIAAEDRVLMLSVARVVLSDHQGSLAEQINRQGALEIRMPALPLTSPVVPIPVVQTKLPVDLILTNGFGGFTPDGREYVIDIRPGQMTPAPWSNVLANAHFGTVISESGQSYTWGENAHEFRLTPWNNDPVSDSSGEVFYLRDDDSGQVWSPTALPCGGQGNFVVRHGFGYSVFEHTEHGVRSDLTVYVAVDASLKFSVLKIRNDSGTVRRLSATGYVEWVLGDMRAKTSMHVITEADPVTGALFAKNAFNVEFPERIAFFYADSANTSVTGDRNEFIGRNGSLQQPAALSRSRLSGRLGAGLDPCAAIQVPFVLLEGQEREIVFVLGVAGRRSADVSELVQRFRSRASAREALVAVKAYWQETLGAVQIETPDVAVNVLANGWLMYQTIACRLWARSGYYQSGGAFGFRDQLQDVMAMVHTRPALLRSHLLLCAAHQFEEGDVQHWWHPPTDRGVRTHCSDDYLWLPLAVHRYVTCTGDTGVLDETAHYLQGRALRDDENSYYDLPARSPQSGSIYEHCVRAIERGLGVGEHGLPLMGSCDWNDGMDKVGEKGKGESVWLAFFLYDVLNCFSAIAVPYGDAIFATRCLDHANNLKKMIEANAWDGEWYRRAYFDNGSPLGSATNDECKIDSISQSWAVLSGAGNSQRTASAMQAVDAKLVRRDHALIQLLDPPFDKSDLDPGYIRGYAPGVRENGGQYTHAAVWTAMAYARLGDSARAWELLGMINPINHSRTPQETAIYKVEPYVVAADVYAVDPHVGRGGWTWYTGSSGWLYRLIVESLVGVNLVVDRLYIKPCLPVEWDKISLRYQFRNTPYHIVVRQSLASKQDAVGLQITSDGFDNGKDFVALVDDGEIHHVEVRIVVSDIVNG